MTAADIKCSIEEGDGDKLLIFKDGQLIPETEALCSDKSGHCYELQSRQNTMFGKQLLKAWKKLKRYVLQEDCVMFTSKITFTLLN